jgi:hypothetical protein
MRIGSMPLVDVQTRVPGSTHPNEWINTKDRFSNWLQITPQHDYSDVNRRVLGRHDLLTIVCQSMRIGAILTSI